MSEHTNQCPVCESGACSSVPWLVLFAVAGLTTAAILAARRVQRTASMSADEILSRCDEAAKALDRRMSSGLTLVS